jgi:hypothetical protein
MSVCGMDESLGQGDLPVAFLHVAAQYSVTVGLRSWNDICLVTSAMPHDVCAYLGSPSQHDLSAGWKALGIFDSWQRPSRVAYAIEDNLCCRVCEGILNGGKLLSNETDAVSVLQLIAQIYKMLRAMYCNTCE